MYYEEYKRLQDKFNEFIQPFLTEHVKTTEDLEPVIGWLSKRFLIVQRFSREHLEDLLDVKLSESEYQQVVDYYQTKSDGVLLDVDESIQEFFDHYFEDKEED